MSKYLLKSDKSMLESVYLIKSKVKSRLLGVLFSNASKRYYLSELARLVDASVGNVQRELERFTKDGLVQFEKKGNLSFYFLNLHHALYPEIESLVLKTVGIEGGLRALVAKDKEIGLALLYGSFAKKAEHGESDIDLLIVSEGKLEKFYSSISRLESRFGREINPTVYSRAEFVKKIAARNSFIENVLKNPHRILKGSLDEYRKKPA